MKYWIIWEMLDIDAILEAIEIKSKLEVKSFKMKKLDIIAQKQNEYLQLKLGKGLKMKFMTSSQIAAQITKVGHEICQVN